ncbi:MAG TPA: TolC family protein [Bryobacteraceae bacterium]|nr:TolC family protein [Bryobacteraceae bacterium]
MKAGYVRILAGSTISWALAWAQTPVVSLAQAEQTALRNHPQIAAAALEAEASGFAEREVRAAYYPTLSGNVTGVGSEHNSVLSAGAVTTSSIYNRGATGIVASQLLTDFGRTASLEQSAKLRTASRNQDVTNTRAEVLVEVRQAYYQALASESVLKVAQATLDLRRVTLRQVTALAQSALRSTVDVSFAQVNLSQAELDLFSAQNDAKAGHARLSAAMGYQDDQPFGLADEPLPAALNPDVDGLIADALRERPDLGALRFQRDSLASFAQAEKRLRNPTVSAAAVGGVAPVRDDRLPETYSAAGVNVNIPVLNGGLFKARREEAESHAAAADKDVQSLSVRIARDVRMAWLSANDAFQRLDVTARMVAEANEALRLAQARYDNALGSIVELNQAQLDQTAAEIAAASAKYEYLSRRADLDYAIGILR